VTHDLNQRGEVILPVSGFDGCLEKPVEGIRHGTVNSVFPTQLEQMSKRPLV
jgi:hypothetical protein